MAPVETTVWWPVSRSKSAAIRSIGRAKLAATATWTSAATAAGPVPRARSTRARRKTARRPAAGCRVTGAIAAEDSARGRWRRGPILGHSGARRWRSAGCPGTSRSFSNTVSSRSVGHLSASGRSSWAPPSSSSPCSWRTFSPSRRRRFPPQPWRRARGAVRARQDRPVLGHHPRPHHRHQHDGAAPRRAARGVGGAGGRHRLRPPEHRPELRQRVDPPRRASRQARRLHPRRQQLRDRRRHRSSRHPHHHPRRGDDDHPEQRPGDRRGRQPLAAHDQPAHPRRRRGRVRDGYGEGEAGAARRGEERADRARRPPRRGALSRISPNRR